MTEVETKLDFTETELQKFNATSAGIADLKKQYMLLKINGIDDEEGQKAVKDARQVMVKHRTGVDKLRKQLNDAANTHVKRVNEEAKSVTARLLEIENHLVAEEKKVTDEIERIKREKEDAEEKLYVARVAKLCEIGFRFDGIKYVADYLDEFSGEKIQIAVLHVKKWDTIEFDEFFDNAKHYFEIQKSIAEKAVKEAQEIADRQAEEMARLKKLSAEMEQREQALKQAEESLRKERELKEASDRQTEETILREERLKQQALENAEKEKVIKESSIPEISKGSETISESNLKGKYKFYPYTLDTRGEEEAYRSGFNFSIEIVMSVLATQKEEKKLDGTYCMNIDWIKQSIEKEIEHYVE